MRVVTVARIVASVFKEHVQITMRDHTHFGKVGVVSLLLRNPAGIPNAILIAFEDGISDWFFDEKESLVRLSDFN